MIGDGIGGHLHRLPPDEWVSGRPMSSVIMAAFCHPRAGDAWYAAESLATANAEVFHQRGRELEAIGVWATRTQRRLYHADFGGAEAVDYLADKLTSVLSGITNGQLSYTPLDVVASSKKTLDPKLLAMAEILAR